MYKTWISRTRAERLLALGRLTLALVSMIAIYLDPTEPASHAGATYALLAAYLLFALAATAIVWTYPAVVGQTGVAVHVFDLAVYSVLVYLTQGPNSPFFAWFVFALFSAALRFGRLGLIWTSVAAILVFNLVGILSILLQPDIGFELNRFLIRSAYLVIVAALLLYLAHHQSGLQSDLLSLSAWPRFESLEIEEVVDDVFTRSTEIFRVTRAVLLIRERHSSTWREIVWDRGGLAEAEFAGGDRDEQEPFSFLSRDLSANPGTVLVKSGHKMVAFPSPGLIDSARERHQFRAVLGVGLDGTAFEGWLLFIDRPDFTIDDLTLGEAVRHAVVAQIDAHLMALRAQKTAVASDRVRLSLQLHDGLLQSMTGVVHYLDVVHRVLAADPEAAREKITEVQGLLMEDQRNLRVFLQQLSPPPFKNEQDLSNQLHQLADRFRRQWGLQIDLRVQSQEIVSPTLRSEIYNLASEALFNIVKHAEAQVARLFIQTSAGRVNVVVEDDGHGYPFEGRFVLEQLEAMMSGPLSIKRRVAACGGELALETGPHGTRLEIDLPLEAASS